MPTKRILAIGDADSLAETRDVLRRSEFDMQRVPVALAATQMVRRIAFDLIIVVHPLADAEFADLYRRIRAAGSPCRQSQLLVLTSGSRLPELDAFHRDARLEAVDLAQPPHALAEAAARYLGPIRTAARLALRLPVVWPTIGAARTVDLSASGALIEPASGTLPPLGERGALELDTGTGPPIRLIAEVARHAGTEQGTPRFAVSWIGAEEGQLARLEAVLARAAGGG